MHQPQTNSGNAAENDVHCMFPSIAGRYTDKIKFDDHVVRALQALARGDATRVHLALSAVWAIALWRFAECDTPRFRVRMEEDVSDNGNPRIFGTSIDPARPVSLLFDEKNWERYNVTAGHAARINTEIVVGAASDMDAYRISPLVSVALCCPAAITDDEACRSHILGRSRFSTAPESGADGAYTSIQL